MQKKSKIEIIPWKQAGWKKIKEAEVPERDREVLDPIIDKFGCEILAVKEQK